MIDEFNNVLLITTRSRDHQVHSQKSAYADYPMMLKRCQKCYRDV